MIVVISYISANTTNEPAGTPDETTPLIPPNSQQPNGKAMMSYACVYIPFHIPLNKLIIEAINIIFGDIFAPLELYKLLWLSMLRTGD